MRALVFQHELHEDAGLFAPALARVGFTLQTRFREVDPSDEHADLVVVLGGTMAAHATASHPFLDAELELLVRRLQRGAPCLGICLGAQLLARAAGGRVFRGEAGTELGGLPVQWTVSGRSDPVLGVAAATLLVAQWHQDTWAEVPGAVPLATSERYAAQAFRIGPSYAFQFHLELDAAAFTQWLQLDADALLANGHDTATLLRSAATLQTHDSARRCLIDRLADHFAAVCRRRS